MKKTILFIVLALLCLNFKAKAQNNAQPPAREIKGKVVDEQGQPLLGATIKITIMALLRQQIVKAILR